jgi:hypothetical protein
MLLDRLERLAFATPWDQRAARTWWEQHEPGL